MRTFEGAQAAYCVGEGSVFDGYSVAHGGEKERRGTYVAATGVTVAVFVTVVVVVVGMEVVLSTTDV